MVFGEKKDSLSTLRERLLKTATIIGETHTSRKKAQILVDLIKSKKYDALLVENREENPLKDAKLSFSYLLFLLGWVEWLFLRKLYASKREVYKCAEELHIPVYRIDASFPEIFDMAGKLKYIILPLLFTFSTILLLFTTFPINLAGYLLFIFGPFISFACVVTTPKRNEYMAKSILRIMNSEGFNKVLISCGSCHAKKIAIFLRQTQIKTEVI